MISSSEILGAKVAVVLGSLVRRLSLLKGCSQRFLFSRDSLSFGEAYFDGGRLRPPPGPPGLPCGRPPRERPPRRPQRPPRPRSPPRSPLRSLPRSPPRPKFWPGRSLVLRAG